MKRIIIVMAAIALLGLIISCGGGEPVEITTTSDGFKQVKAIDMVFQWKIQGGNIEIKVTSPEKGWIGVGFDPDSLMKGANFIVGYVDGGVGYIEDHYGHKSIEHESDVTLGGSDDVTLIDSSENASGTMLHFSMPLDSGDEYDKPIVAGQSYKVLLAYHASDDFVTEHSKSTRDGIEFEL